MSQSIVVIPTNLERNRLGLPSRVAHEVAGRTVLEHTVEHAAAIEGIDAVVLVHPPGQDPLALLRSRTFARPVAAVAFEAGLFDEYHAMRIAARKWSLCAWRGGLGGATVYDELLPAAPILHALEQHEALSAVLVGPDWPLLDPAITSRVLALHLSDRDALGMTFCQAPPGLAGVAISRKLIAELARQPDGSIGRMLAYVPSRPQADPIGKDVCVQIDPAIRSLPHRFIYDVPAGIAAVEARLTNQARDLFFPQQVTVELTPRRAVRGPITPQHHVAIDRPDMSVDLAIRIVRQLGEIGGVALTLGGLGDALLHPNWRDIVAAARDAGVLGIAVQTDLLVDEPTLALLLDAPIDAVIVNVNADTARTYEQVMGADRFGQLVENLQWLLVERAKRTGPRLMPWLVPSLIKTRDTLGDMETFFDRWTHFAGHAVIAPATSGAGAMPEQSPVLMAPPRRRPCRQLDRRLTIHSDGAVPRCDQDWLARAPLGHAATHTIAELWHALDAVRDAHAQGRLETLTICNACHEWHRP